MRSIVIKLRCTQEEREAIMAAAEEHDTTMSDLLRTCFVAVCGEPIKTKKSDLDAAQIDISSI